MEIAGFDDGFFPAYYKSRKGYTILAGVKTSNLYILSGVGFTQVLVDGRETTEKIVSLSRILRPDVIFLDGITYAGFDVADPDAIYSSTGFPVITVQQYPLNISRIRKALENNFEDFRERLEVILRIWNKFNYLDTPWKMVQFYAVGISLEKALAILRSTMIYSPVPEPLRIAHMLASAVSRMFANRHELIKPDPRPLYREKRARRDLNPGPTG